METRRKSSWMLWTCWVLHVSNNFFHCSEFQSFHCLISSLCCLLSPNPLPSPFALILHLVLTHPTARDTSRTQPAAAAAKHAASVSSFFVRSFFSPLHPLSFSFTQPHPLLYSFPILSKSLIPKPQKTINIIAREAGEVGHQGNI
jgi:hypothetical protein